MPREKQNYRENLADILEFTGGKRLLSVKEVKAYTGFADERSLKRRYPSYAGYIDFRTLAILFSLMTVMAGLRGQGVFSRMGQALLGRTGGVFPLVLVLVGLCFFGSMLITNDVALLTFVPFTFAVLGRLEPKLCRALAVPVV